ncbi:hypothetical protein [Methylobacterium durans]|uniref:hypothetical protein n=1 Tax=Methylobacterium durans TaxID=2202825 RepID=UPI0013A556CF|nr:hypothetical protein [Methylobacterium durans]
MASSHSKERKQADAEFAKTQSLSRLDAAKASVISPMDEKNARLKAARLARDAADGKPKGKGKR